MSKVIKDKAIKQDDQQDDQQDYMDLAQMILDKVSVVLVCTSHPGNIGSTARAMKTMGIRNLILVNPKEFPSPVADSLAAGCTDILTNARVVDTLEQALEGHNLVFATSARDRSLAHKVVSSAQAAKLAIDFLAQDISVSQNLLQNLSHTISPQKVAVLFGQERTGLDNKALGSANYHVIIPTDKKYSSLNLSQAVQIICYEFLQKVSVKVDEVNKINNIEINNIEINNIEINKNNNKIILQDQLADAAQVQKLLQHLQEVMLLTGFIDSKQPKKLMLRLQALFQRSKLTVRELNILRGICAAVLKKI